MVGRSLPFLASLMFMFPTVKVSGDNTESLVCSFRSGCGELTLSQEFGHHPAVAVRCNMQVEDEELLGAGGGRSERATPEPDAEFHQLAALASSTAYAQPNGVTQRRGVVRGDSTGGEEGSPSPGPQRMVFLEERMSAMETTLAVMSRAMERLAFLAEPERGRELRAGSMWDVSVGSSQGFADLPAPKGREMRKEPGARPKTQTSLTRVEESDDEGEKPPRIPATLPAETLVPLANAGRGTGPREAAAGPTGLQGGLRRAENWGLPPQGPLPRREELRIEFGGESSELDFFLTTVRGYMEDNAHTFRTESSRIRAIGAVLKRGAASWYVQLHARRDPCLGSLRRFMGALETRFRDPLEQIRAREKLKTVSQGQRSVSEYAEEFQCLAEKVPEWSAVTKIELFKEGLRREILSWAVHRDEPDTLRGWIQLAGRVETSLAQARRHRGGLQQRPQMKEGSQEVEREPGKRGEEDSIRIAELADKLPPEYRDFVDVFDEKEADNFPPKRRVEVKIELVPGAELPKAKIYPMSAREKEELRKYIDKNLARGFIEPSNSPLGAPVLFRRKKDQTLRLCIDYRGLNAISTVNKYPLPLVKDLIAQLSEGQIFTKLDLIEAYHKLQIKPEDRWKTAFSCAFGLFNYRVLPFGLCGGGAAFMQLINEVLHPLLYKGVFIFLDDILIMSRTKEQHVELVREVLQKLREAKLYAKLAKCEFNKDQIDFLGYRISSQGVAMDPAKVEDVRGWEAPKTRKQLQSFLGFANFYRTFIKDFARLTLPLTDLLKTKGRGETAKVKAPGAKLTWTIECQEAFEALKKLFTEEPVLQHPDMSKAFVLHCDASDRAYGAVLLQKDGGGNLKPCGYLSKKFSDTEKNWPIWEREALAILKALECWRHFLEGSGTPFEVWTDHRNLQYLRSPRKLSAKQIRWAQYFSRFDFRLRFFQGKHNILADALSRMPQHGGGIQESEGSLFLDKQWGLAVLTRAQAAKENKRTAISTGGGEIWEEELKRAYGMDKWLQTNKEKGELCGDLVFVNKKLYIPECLRREMLRKCHDNKGAGHLGPTRTIKLLAKKCWWPGMRKDARGYVTQCELCAEGKTEGGGAHEAMGMRGHGFCRRTTPQQRPQIHLDNIGPILKTGTLCGPAETPLS
uniref:Gypsy retrotransposon integrase-like protein 1 n=1 Tax=Anolis carolinensis TaxID=28377 RepID=A0A803T247_ANOCA